MHRLSGHMKYTYSKLKLSAVHAKLSVKKPLKTYKTYLESTQAIGWSVSIAEAHCSFDFNQQVHIRSDAFQPGPVYFLTPHKCALFGVCCEAIPKQVNLTISCNEHNSFIPYLLGELSDWWRCNGWQRCQHGSELVAPLFRQPQFEWE